MKNMYMSSQILCNYVSMFTHTATCLTLMPSIGVEHTRAHHKLINPNYHRYMTKLVDKK